MSKIRPSFLALCLFVFAWGLPVAQAQWNNDGNVVSSASYDQVGPQIVTDGSGGAIIIWEDNRSTDTDIFVQRIDYGGAVMWTADGLVICSEDGSQIWPDLVHDGAGGAIMTWSDPRQPGTYEVYVQKVNSSGAVQWEEDGKWINYGAYESRVVLDGAGGAFVSWTEAATVPNSIALQRIDSTGYMLWSDYVTAGIGNTSRLVSDDAGGVVVGWQRFQSSGYHYWVRGQRLDETGNLLWPSSEVSPSYGCEFEAQIASDGTGGGIWVWEHGNDVIAQRVDGAGSLQWGSGTNPFWYVVVASSPQVISDGASGALVVVEAGGAAIFMNRILADGSLDWTTHGLAVCTAPEIQQTPQLAPDGHGGAYVVWQDHRDHGTSGIDIYAQLVDADGNPQWAADGVPICTAAGDQTNVVITATGDHSAIITWQDTRNGASDVDIYAQAIHYDGSIGNPPFNVVAVSPLACAIHVPLDTDMTATFNSAANPATLGNATVVAHGSLSGLHQGIASYDGTTNTMTFDPTDDFDYGEVVTVVLTDGIESEIGSPLSHLAWTFTTETRGVAGEFLNAESYATQHRPVALCAADLDGDNDMDLVAANYESHTISVLRGNGDGTFATQVTYPTGYHPASVIAADVDRDGDLELITADYDEAQVSVFNNNGTGGFHTPLTYDVGGGPKSVFAGDFDGDGHLDLATANSASYDISVLMNRGDGTFYSDMLYNAGDHPIFITGADLNNDGYIDLVTANEVYYYISVFLNQGTGHFETVFVFVGYSPDSVYPADLDKDGDFDLILAAGHEDRVLLLFNNGDGTFATAVPYAAGGDPHMALAADVDGDEDLDLLHCNANSNNIWVRLNDGAGNFGAEAAYATSPYPNALVAADFDEDGALDLASANRNGDDVTVLLNHASISGVESGGVPAATALCPNVPNPFNPSTRIDYTLKQDGHVRLVIYNTLGEEVVTLVDEYQTAREGSVYWDGRDRRGKRATSGVYFYRLLTGDFEEARKMVLIK